MKKTEILTLPAFCLLLTGCGEREGTGSGPWPWILGILGVLALLLAGLRTYQYMRYRRRRQRRGKRNAPFSLDMVIKALGTVGILLLLCACIVGVLSAPKRVRGVETPEESTRPSSGWMTDVDGSRYYQLENGHRAIGWLDIGEKKYYFDENGHTFSGWVQVEGVQRYFRTDGSMARGKVVIDGKTHHFTSTGAEVVLVNPWNPVPEGYQVELVELSNIYSTAGITVGAEMEEDLLRMMNECNAQSGGRSCVVSGYRDISTQNDIYEDEVEKLTAQGYSEAAAKTEAATRVALPGTSEHQMGLAVDINDTQSWGVDVSQEELPAIQWLMEHCYEYGFILRYPEGKTPVTGIIYEPWHFRYVGTELSMELKELGLTLEEYLDSLH